MRLLLLGVLALALCGCTRAFYRKSADRETYGAIDERDHDPRWVDPHVSVNVPPESRLFDPFNPDRPPLPPDDPAAHRYMHCANGMRGYRYWHKHGDAPWIIDPGWQNYLPLDDKGELVLTPEQAITQALLHSREYQTQIQTVYLDALALTLNRFEFALHWFATNDTLFTHFGSGDTEVNTTTSNSTFGFTKALAAGGQFMVETLNNVLIQFAGPETTVVTSNIVVNFTQPFLRGFGRQVRMEALTEGERTLLYAIRTFARFRKTFSFNILTQTYLNLLTQTQSIRNQEQAIQGFRQTYELLVALRAIDAIASVQVEQAYLSLLNARATLVQLEANLQTGLDNYKLVLGLPPAQPVRMDDSVLKQFEFNDPAIPALQEQLDAFLASYRELPEVPSVANLKDAFKKLQTFHAQTVKLTDEVQAEIERWRKQLETPAPDPEEGARERQDWQTRVKDLASLRDDMEAVGKGIERDLRFLTEARRPEVWKALRVRIGEETAVVAKLFIIQTQVRVFLIQLVAVPYEEKGAFAYALENRLDLMNERGRVTDAWRQITVTANALRGVFNATFNANIATPPLGTNPVDFRASASQYSVGFHAEAPLNRVAERNAYRAAQVNYQQERRQYIALHDQIQHDIRLDLRNLRVQRINFEITRRSLISATRQVEFAREDLLVRGAEADPTSTLNVLNALNGVLSAKNTLIGSWVAYETARYQLLLDMELMQVDARGLYIDVVNTPEQPAAPAVGGGGVPGEGEVLPEPRLLEKAQ